MTTSAEIREAHDFAPRQRFALRGLMKVDETRACTEDLALVAKVRAVSTPAEYDKAIADRKVSDLFRRGVLYFGDRP